MFQPQLLINEYLLDRQPVRLNNHLLNLGFNLLEPLQVIDRQQAHIEATPQEELYHLTAVSRVAIILQVPLQRILALTVKHVHWSTLGE